MTQNITTAVNTPFPPRYGLRGKRTTYVDPTVEDSLPEVGQSKILDLLGSLTGRQLGLAASLAPRSEQTLFDLLDGMDPAQDLSRARAAAGSLMGAAREAGQGAAMGLARRGYGGSVLAGAQLDALNRGASRAHDSLLDVLSPERRQKRQMAQWQMMNSLQVPPVLAARLQSYGAEGQRRLIDKQTSGPGFMDSLMDILGTAAPYAAGGF